MRIGNVELDHLRGFGDKVAGLTKEVVGTVVGNDRLAEAGEAQQARGSDSIKALRKQAKARPRRPRPRPSSSRSGLPRGPRAPDHGSGWEEGPAPAGPSTR